jgi:hypothetical protein
VRRPVDILWIGLCIFSLAVFCTHAAQADSIFLVIAADGTFDGYFVSEGTPSTGESYIVVHYADVTGGVYPAPLAMNVATDVATGITGGLAGSEYFYVGSTSLAGGHLLVGSPGLGDAVPTPFAFASLDGIEALNGGALSGLGDLTTMDAETFWGVFESANGSFSDEEYADFINNTAGLIPFGVISTITPEEDTFDGMGIDNLLGFTDLVVQQTDPSFLGTLSVFTFGGLLNDPDVIDPNQLFNPAPEPAALLLVLCGAGIAVWRRRRRA